MFPPTYARAGVTTLAAIAAAEREEASRTDNFILKKGKKFKRVAESSIVF